MQEIFDKIPMSKFEEYVVELLKKGNKEEARKLATIIAIVKFNSKS